MIFTLEAIYALHMFNDHSDDIAFLPLPAKEGETRKEALLRIVEKGFEDLSEMELIVDGTPTEECIQYGVYLDEYAQANYHCNVNQMFYYSPNVDEYDRMAIIIIKNDANEFLIDRAGTAIFLASLISLYPILQNVDANKKDYLHSEWETEAYLKLVFHHPNDDALRIQINDSSYNVQDRLYYRSDQYLYEYDMENQSCRSISGDQFKKQLIQKLKVKGELWE